MYGCQTRAIGSPLPSREKKNIIHHELQRLRVELMDEEAMYPNLNK
jgi:hypothetical protein